MTAVTISTVGAILFIFVPIMYELYDSRNVMKDIIFSSTKEEYIKNEQESFDFIVIGGGSAGAVVANRLSKKFQVLLLEAGGDPNPVSSVPYLQGALYGTSMDYQYETTPQQNCCLSLEGQKMQWPRGKVLGGCSSINNMLYLRGNSKDFDNWANITGDPEWSYEKLLPFFKRSEDYHGNYELGSDHEVGNELYVGKLSYVPQIGKRFFAAVHEQGLLHRDFNSHQPSKGFMSPDFTIKNGERWGTFQAFLEPILSRTSLQIYRYSQVNKIHLDDSNRAYGITYIRHQKQHFVTARNEIILSGGTIDSPKLLMQSGIGPTSHLNSLGIKPRINLPVGQNLQDHVATFIGPILVNQSVSFLKDRDLTNEAFQEYFNNKTVHKEGNPFSSPQERFANGYFSSSSQDENMSWPDIYFILYGYGIYHGYGGELSKRYKALPGILEKYYDEHVGKDGFLISVILSKPESRGEIRLAGKDPNLKPILDPKYYSQPSDIRRLVEGIIWILKFFENSKVFKELGARLAQNSFPGCETIEFQSKEYWECYARHFTATLSHQVGTCRMGSGPNDSKAVVDSRLRVIQVSGLRVIDASVMPEIVNGNTNAATIMIGEVGSKFILQDWST